MWGNESSACTGVTAHTEEAIDLDDIEASIEALEDDMEDTNTRITGYASDNVLSIGEKAELAKDWLSIKNDRYQKIKTEAENHGMNLAVSSYKTDYDNFVTAYNALLDWVDGSSSNIALVPTPPDTLQESSFTNVCSTTAQKFADYQTCEIKLLSDIDKDNKNRATAIYAECNTPADDASKIVILPDVVIFDGLRLCVKFLNGNSTIQTITLNIKRDESDVSGLIDGGQLYTEKGIAVPVITINAGEMITFVLVERKIIDYSNGTSTTTLIKVWEFADSALLGMGQNGTVQNETYSLGMVNGGHIIAHTVDTQQLKAQSVTTDILKAGAVTTDKITSEQIIGRDFRTDTDVGIRDSLTGLYNGGVMFDGNGIKGYDQYGQTVSIGTNGTITALRGEIGGWIIGDDSLESTGMRDMESYDPQTSTPVKTIIIKSNGMIYTSDFVSGYSGWRIDSEGNAEFNSAIIRGSIKSAVFEYDKVSAVGGKMLVKEASIIIDNPDHITTSTKIHVLNPESFNAGDCFLVKYDASNLFYGVISAVDKTTSSSTYGDITYSIPSNAGTFFRTITVDGETVPVLDGLSIVNYGQPSAGGLMIDGNNTHIDIFRNISTNNQHTFSGDAIQLEHLARFGNMNGIGGITTDVYGLYIGDANGFIRYDPDGGLVIKNDITSGGFLKSDNFSWDDSGTTRYDIVPASSVASGEDYTKTGMLINMNTGIISGSAYRFEADGDFYSKGSLVLETSGNRDVGQSIPYKDTSIVSYGNLVLYNDHMTGTSAHQGHANGCIIMNAMNHPNTLGGITRDEIVRIKTRQFDYNYVTPPTFSLDFARAYKNSNGTVFFESEPGDYDGYSEYYRSIISIKNGTALSDYYQTNPVYTTKITSNSYDEIWKSGLHIVSDSTHVNTINKLYLDDVSALENGDYLSLKVNNRSVTCDVTSVNTTDNSIGVHFPSYYEIDTFIVVDGDDVKYKKKLYPSSYSTTIFTTDSALDQISSSQQFVVSTYNGVSGGTTYRFWGYVNSKHYATEHCPAYFSFTRMYAEPTDFGIYAADDRDYIPDANDDVTFYDQFSFKGRQYTAQMTIGSDIFPKYRNTDSIEHGDYKIGSSGKDYRWYGFYGMYGSFGYYSNTPQCSKVEIGTDVYYGEGVRIYSGSSSNAGIMLAGRDNLSATGTSANSYYIVNENGTFKIYKNTTAVLTYDTTNGLTSDGGFTGNLTGTATNATNANNVKLTHTVGNNEYPLVFGSSFVTTNAQQALRIGTPSANANHCPLRVKAYCAAANTQGEAHLVLGNALAKTSANNARGGLVMYGTGTAYSFIKMNTVNTNAKTIFLNTANTTDITLTLPSATGTIALTSSCDPAIKTELQDVECLDILKTLTVKRFKYSQKKIDEKQWKKDNPDKPLSEMPEFKDNEHEPWYIHTMAQEFNEAFDVDDGNPDEIKPINEIGVCLRAIQELAEKVDKLEQKLAKLS
jgi:hypothetical protein